MSVVIWLPRASQWSSKAGQTNKIVDGFEGNINQIGIYGEALSSAEIGILADVRSIDAAAVVQETPEPVVVPQLARLETVALTSALSATTTLDTITLDDDNDFGRVRLSEYFSASNNLTFSLEGAPEFARVNTNNNLLFFTDEGDAGDHTFTVIATDENGQSEALEVNVIVEDKDASSSPAVSPVTEPEPDPEPSNTAPIVSNTLDAITLSEDAAYLKNMANYFSDADGDSLSFSLTGAPDFVSINANNRLAINTNDGDDGTYTFEVYASDGEDTSNALTVNLTVEDTISPPATNPNPPSSDYTPTDHSIIADEADFTKRTIGTQEWEDGVTVTGYDAHGDLAEVRWNDRFEDPGIGILGEDSRWIGQIDYFNGIDGGSSEKMVIDFNGDVSDISLHIGQLGLEEGPRPEGGGARAQETGKWTAYDENGKKVASGAISPEFSSLGENTRVDGSYGVYRFDIDPNLVVDQIVLEATAWEGDSLQQSYGENNSDFNLIGIDFTRVEEVEDYIL